MYPAEALILQEGAYNKKVRNKMQATKVKELWRDSSGHFAKAPEPIAIPKVENKKEDGNVIIGLVMLGMGVVVLLFIIWQLTLSVLGVAGARYAYIKYREYKAVSFPINYCV